MKSSSEANPEFRQGLLYGLAAYGMWGFFPAYYKLTDSVPADLIVAHRIVWAAFFVGLFLVVRRRMDEVWDIFRQPRLVGLLSVSATLVAVNWLIFVWAIGQERILEVSLGYFINPLVSILIGLVVLRERLRRLQAVAVALAAFAVCVQAVIAGGLPWISLGLAVSFGAYGYVRKITPVPATPGMFVETVLLSPLAAGYLAIGLFWGADIFVRDEPLVFIALMGTGIITALPLICFSAAARRLPLVLIGLMQYMAPSIHFVMAVYVWGEPLDPAKLLTFVIIWTALAIFSFDAWRAWVSGATDQAKA